ncbi:hydantoinase B/oxoprolinase family protein, partial [Paracoccus sp. APAP_BH8]|uniref:hydantoinase B/oxoprolinase family protein n=1 Tax=Paracoccus sp. APAP_BH8 TaxID=3110237 RepID=UPI002FD82B53
MAQSAAVLVGVEPVHIGEVLATVPGVAGVGSGSFFGQGFNIRGRDQGTQAVQRRAVVTRELVRIAGVAVDAGLANDPAHGGSHIIDTCMYYPVFYQGELVFWTVCKGH